MVSPPLSAEILPHRRGGGKGKARKGVDIIPEKKEEILEAIGKEIPGMAEKDKTYLMGFLEGMAAGVGNLELFARADAGKAVAQQDSA